jgi:hypothetical protein
MRYDIQINGRIQVSILRTTRRSMALSFRSGMYVVPTAMSCSIAPCSGSFALVVDILGGYLFGIVATAGIGTQRNLLSQPFSNSVPPSF